ncbi:MAG: methyltransferase domain-containing protein [Sneathiella sp.]
MSKMIKKWRQIGAKLETKHDGIQFLSALEYIDKINLKNVKTLADVGAGPGHQAYIFSKREIDVTCIDYVRPRYDLPWLHPENTSGKIFDAIWSHHCLEHIRDPIGALLEWSKLLPVSGRLFLTCPQIGLNMSTGHVSSFNIPHLIYLLALSGYDCSEKQFTISRSHLRANVRKSAFYDPVNEGVITDLRELAKRGSFGPSITRAIEERGRFSAKDIHLDWFGENSTPNPLAEEAFAFTMANLWLKK